jgi:PAS domain S-box-containing protein
MMDAPDDIAGDVLLAAFERASDAVVILDHDHHVSHFNAAAELVWGMPRAEVLGRHAAHLGLKHLDEARSTEMTIARADDSRIRVSLALSHVLSGGLRRTIAVVRDITSELELKERLGLHVLIADGTNRSVIITDRNLKIVYTNAKFAGTFGHSIADVLGKQVNELLAGPHTDPAVLRRLQRCVGSEDGGDVELLAYDKNGDEIWLSAHVKAFRNARGRVKYLVALLTDITESKQWWSLQQLIMTALAD